MISELVSANLPKTKWVNAPHPIASMNSPILIGINIFNGAKYSPIFNISLIAYFKRVSPSRFNEDVGRFRFNFGGYLGTFSNYFHYHTSNSNFIDF